MRAVLTDRPGGPENLRIVDVPTPLPGPMEVLVQVRATALNRADTLQRKGKYDPPEGVTKVPGLEAAGVVTDLGSDVRRWRRGDRVFGLLAGGAHAEYAVFHRDLLLPIPDRLSFVEAAAIPEVFLTAFQALVLIGHIARDEIVLIHAGGSGVGTAAIQIARVYGASPIVTASAGKHEACRSLGAVLAIDYKSQDFAEEVMSFTGGTGANVILDFIGAPYLEANVRASAVDGRVVLLALMGGATVDSLGIGSLFRKRLTITASTLRNRPLPYKIDLVSRFADSLMAMIASRKIAPVIDTVTSWENIVDAHRRMEANLNTGKIVLKVA
ncbi:MAG: NAD(P)H-quinone oxidoreductase [Rhodothermia bacterium]|nr:NAD(P)H-quinone oxidoreductase [Rhodothermia bacterium]